MALTRRGALAIVGSFIALSMGKVIGRKERSDADPQALRVSLDDADEQTGLANQSGVPYGFGAPGDLSISFGNVRMVHFHVGDRKVSVSPTEIMNALEGKPFGPESIK